MIYQILNRENSNINIFKKRNNYLKTKKIFNHIIFIVNKYKLLLINKYKLDIILYIIRNNQK